MFVQSKILPYALEMSSSKIIFPLCYLAHVRDNLLGKQNVIIHHSSFHKITLKLRDDLQEQSGQAVVDNLGYMFASDIPKTNRSHDRKLMRGVHFRKHNQASMSIQSKEVSPFEKALDKIAQIIFNSVSSSLKETIFKPTKTKSTITVYEHNIIFEMLNRENGFKYVVILPDHLRFDHIEKRFIQVILEIGSESKR